MNDEDVFFIDYDGNRISLDDISSHIGLAVKIIESNATLKEEFKNSEKQDPVDFLISDKGYMKLTEQRWYKKCIYMGTKLSNRQKELCRYFEEEGYELEDQYRLKLMQEER